MGADISFQIENSLLPRCFAVTRSLIAGNLTSVVDLLKGRLVNFLRDIPPGRY